MVAHGAGAHGFADLRFADDGVLGSNGFERGTLEKMGTVVPRFGTKFGLNRGLPSGNLT